MNVLAHPVALPRLDFCTDFTSCLGFLCHCCLSFPLSSPPLSQQELVDDAGNSVDEKFLADLYQCEIDRIRYLLKSYLRTRFLKITQYARYILQDQELCSRLSHAELEEVAVPYMELLEKNLEESFLKHLPEKFQSHRGKHRDFNLIAEPNLDEYVFCKVLEDIGQVQVGEDDETPPVELLRGDIYTLRYRPMRSMVRERRIQLL